MSTAPARMNPFPGLRPFTQEEDYLFFGREEQTLELLQRLGGNRFVAVVGTSGSGKSSLVRCGLLSQLLGGKMLGAGASWEIAVTHPGGNPLALLTDALLEADLYDRQAADARENLLATLSRSHFGLVEAVKQAGLGEGTNFLLVIDQFEEIFRFHEASQTQQEAANEFVSLLLEAAAQKEVPIYVVLTMRSDFIGECGQFEGLAEMVNRGEFLIPRLTREQYKRVIEGPIKVAGGQIAQRLLQRLLNDLGQQADQLPCLQHALMRTWNVWAGKGDTEALDLDDYHRVGKMSQALSLHADEIYESLASDRQRALCQGMFQALTVEEANSRGIRRPQRLGRLCQILEVPADELLPIIGAYRQSGVTFLMPSPEVELTDQTIIDISHESLMRVWTRLRQWVEEETQAAGIYHRLSESAALHAQGKTGLYRDPELGIALAWRGAKRPNAAWADRYRSGFGAAMAFLDRSRDAAECEEKEREAARQRELERARQLAQTQARVARLFKRFAGGLAVGFCLAVAMTIWAFMLRQEAKRQEADAKEQRRIAEEKEKEAKAYGLVQLVLNVDTPKVPAMSGQLADHRHWSDPLLRDVYANARENSPQKLHASLALLPVDPGQVDYLFGRLLEADPKDALPVIRDALAPHKDKLLDKLWAVAEKPEKGKESQRLRAAAALVSYDPDSERWANVQVAVVKDLLAVSFVSHPTDSTAWKDSLRPARIKLLPPLLVAYRSRNRFGEAYPATNVLLDYAADQPQVLADLLMDADEKQFAVIFPKFKEQGDRGVATLTSEFTRELPNHRPETSDWTIRFYKWETAELTPAEWGAVLQSPILDELRMPRLHFFDANQPPVPPTPKVPEYYFAAVATTEVTLGEGAYSISATFDDGIRVWFDKEVIMESWRANSPTTSSVIVANKRGRHTIKVEYFQIKGGYALDVDFAVSDDVKDTLAKRQANAAVALLKMNQPAPLWQFLKHSPDPRARTYLIQRLSPLGADAKAIVKQFDKEADLTIRRALLLSLGGFTEKDFTADDRKEFLPKLRGLYQTASDPGLHAASEWLLRQWKEETWLAETNQAWAGDKKQQLTRLEEIKEELKKEKNKDERRWYVNGQGQTLVVIPGPVEFWMGSPPAEQGRAMGFEGKEELRHWRRIGRSFAIASKEVTAEQFLKFPGRNKASQIYRPSADCPANTVSWYDAAAYCNWLSEQEGIPKEQWCYEPNQAGSYDQGMKMAANYLQRTGYRLPTEAEWEFSCRAGATTKFCFGESYESLPRYAWFVNNSQFRPQPVGTLKPNDLGLFDMHGNANEWCQDDYLPYGDGGDGKTAEDIEGISHNTRVVTRGGSFDVGAASLRSASRGVFSRWARNYNLGFRPARTLPFNSFNRYDAARAALVAAGQRKEDPPLDDTVAKLRRQALDWLKAELADWSKVQPPPRLFIVRNLGQWQRDRDLAGIRDPAALAKLPAEERNALTRFWADVAKAAQPADNAERLVVALAAYDQKKYALAARLWAEALASDPKLGGEHRYNAARAAILAAAAQGIDVPPLDDAAKAKLRGQARDWVTAELTARSKLLESGPARDRPGIVRALSAWQQDRNFASIRDATALAKLPADEQKAWQALWARVPAWTVVPTSREEGLKWRYTTTEPAKGWQKTDFDEKHWQEGYGAFGSGTAYAFRTEWTTADIWLRREFTMPPGEWDELLWLVHHDDDAEVYVNGILALKLSTYEWDELLPLGAAARMALKPGKNIFAVHCHNRIGPQYIDVGIVAVKGNSARLALAQSAYDRKHYAFATQLWAAALAGDSKLGDDRSNGHRYNAACSAALAAAGQAKDEPPLDDAAQAELRRQALDWLKAELAAWNKLLASGTPQDPPFIVQTLSHWQKDSDLAGIRDKEALAKLPEEEQKAFTQLWADVAGLLKKAQEKRQ